MADRTSAETNPPIPRVAGPLAGRVESGKTAGIGTWTLTLPGNTLWYEIVRRK